MAICICARRAVTCGQKCDDLLHVCFHCIGATNFNGRWTELILICQTWWFRLRVPSAMGDAIRDGGNVRWCQCLRRVLANLERTPNAQRRTVWECWKRSETASAKENISHSDRALTRLSGAHLPLILLIVPCHVGRYQGYGGGRCGGMDPT